MALRLPRPLRRRRSPSPEPPATTDLGSAADLGGASDPGPRADNQDRWATGPGWGVVCDGVGGHRGGATASGLAVATVTTALAARSREVADHLLRAAAEANAAVIAGRAADPSVDDMATTLTVAAHDPTATGLAPGVERWMVVQLGDSPAWHVTADEARPITWDHSLVGDLVRVGALTPEEARDHPQRHVITRALGIAETAQPETFAVDLAPGDWLVLASDGLSDVAGPEVVGLVADRVHPPTAVGMAEALVAEALARGTRDNVTVVVVAPPRR